ncbi:MAG TPA: DUF4129 domain-containing protein [Methanospirillum sp.]|uniref:DUF4129 domain-containing protein n=1 Tax=Methanospirillum sp. TaxID=45200 RepID=UPI002B7AB1B9|nr:DUF4129 domain-containing protein [Methanospirillum sp.]HOJ97017.1 DUF4129 domain-containing protein [Methanospirillum sp.]
MNRRVIRYLFILSYIAISLLTAALLIDNGMHPLVYPADKSVCETGYHMNIGDLKKQAFNSSMDLLPLMQELLDYSGTIAVTLRKEDIESARSDLARYTGRYHDLQNLIIKLDMNESELARFYQDTGKQKDILSQFVSTSESLQSLEKLEIHYQDEDNPDSVTKVRIQGKALKNRIQMLQNQYADITDSLSSRGNTFGVNTEPVLQSKAEFERLNGIVAQRQNERDRHIGFVDTGSPFISFLAGPGTVTFQDTIDVYGFVAGSQDRSWPVTITLDDTALLELIPDEIGEYRSQIMIHNISAGEHNLTARWGSIISDSVPIIVTPLETSLTLRVLPVKGMSAVNLTGVVTARNPVPDVPVNIYVQDKVWNTAMTSASGTYLVTLPLSEGTYDMVTRFDDQSYPLLPSESQHYIVESDGFSITAVRSSMTGSFPPWMVILPGFVLFAVPIWYFRRKGIVGKTVPDTENSFKSQNPHELSRDESAFDTIINMRTNDTKYNLNGQEGLSRNLYLEILSVLSHSQGIHISPVMTAREIAGSLPEEAWKVRFIRFIEWYERIRYGGCQDSRCIEELICAANSFRETWRKRRDDI